MLRRFTTLATAVLMLVSVVFFTGRVDPGTGVWLFYLYFSVSFFLLITGVLLTERDYFGPRRHPVNRMFVLLSWTGVGGLLVLMIEIAVLDSAHLWLYVIASVAVLIGVMGSTVVAVSARPWRDLFYSRRTPGGDDRDDRGDVPGTGRATTGGAPVPTALPGRSDAVPTGDDPVHGVPREQPGGGERHPGA
ncbi:hypothetical protein [Corynebacterium nuruki]|uniref:hypothetical protein n=1 Tax=Corynebacterium nuruki TaxID=1032851 RepID=UPI0039BEE840